MTTERPQTDGQSPAEPDPTTRIRFRGSLTDEVRQAACALYVYPRRSQQILVGAIGAVALYVAIDPWTWVPVERRLELELEPPSGWALAERKPRQLKAEWGTIDETLDTSDGSQHSVLRITLPAQTVAPEDYPAFARFCHAVDELTMRPPKLRRSE